MYFCITIFLVYALITPVFSKDKPKEAAVWLDDGNGHTVKVYMYNYYSLDHFLKILISQELKLIVFVLMIFMTGTT